MPLVQIIFNLPFLLVGFLVKYIFFYTKGMGKEYLIGLKEGRKLFQKEKKVPFHWKNLKNYLKIQGELWINIFRKLRNP